MTKSSLCTYTNLTNNCSSRSGQSIKKITPHYMAAHWTGKRCADYFAETSRQASSNYCIGYDGDIAMSVDEYNRAWTSSSPWNDKQAITIEVACASPSDSTISAAAWDALVNLCADICTRYSITPSYDGTKNATFTEHRMFASTDCPGAYMHARMNKLVADVKAKMAGSYSGSTSSNSSALDVDGWWGSATTKRLQEVLGTVADGEIWHQWSGNKSRLAACTSGWQFDSTEQGSPCIKAMQNKLGVSADGLIGKDTINALIKHYQSASGATVLDGKLDGPSLTVKAMQRALNQGKF